MSINKYISELPDTKRGFSEDSPRLVLISGIFITEDDFTIPIASMTDISVFMDALEVNDIIPLHFVKEFEPNDTEIALQESRQDFTYQSSKGRYGHKLTYSWTLEKQQAVELLSGTNKKIIYYDRNSNLLMTSDDGINARGFSTNRIILENPSLPEKQLPMLSKLDIELKDSDELRKRGIVKKLTWNPKDVDRLFASISIEYIDEDTLNFKASYLGVDIDSISVTDVTITDDLTGVLSFDLFNYLGGIYQMSGFSSPLVSGTLEILSTLYLGCIRYSYTITVEPIVTNYEFDGLGVNYEFEDGTNYDFNN